jgi:solute carrier family 50 protein (sugar transporter)
MMNSLPWSTIILAYICPSVGAVLAGIMFAAPVQDLREALKNGSLDVLNPLTWAMMTGNCLGWVAYAYYTHDPFVLAANLPGLIISLWLNIGAIKLQYHDIIKTQQDPESLTMVPQETMLLRILLIWSFVLLWVGWWHPTLNSSHIVGLVVNVNLVFFYGAPLHTIKEVVQTKCSDSIHLPTMVLSWSNTSFWLAYGVARKDPIILIPNALGLLLGLMQGLLCLLYPRSGRHAVLVQQEGNDEEESSRNSLTV